MSKTAIFDIVEGISTGKRLQKRVIGITVFLFVSTQIAALVWVSTTYAIAGYATIVLGQPYPVAELSDTAIQAIIVSGTLKLLNNIWEHNDGFIFGKSNKNKEENDNDAD